MATLTHIFSMQTATTPAEAVWMTAAGQTDLGTNFRALAERCAP